MSDTKALIKYVSDRLNDGPNITFGKPTVRDMVDALEQAEARADFANNVLQAASDCVLSGDPTSDVGLFLDCDEFDKKLLVDIAALRTRAEQAEARVKARDRHICTLLREALTNEYDFDGMKSRLQAAEADNARLTKVVDWLASEHIKLFELMYPHRTGLYTMQTMIEEAARRAVAAGEG